MNTLNDVRKQGYGLSTVTPDELKAGDKIFWSFDYKSYLCEIIMDTELSVEEVISTELSEEKINIEFSDVTVEITNKTTFSIVTPASESEFVLKIYDELIDTDKIYFIYQEELEDGEITNDDVKIVYKKDLVANGEQVYIVEPQRK